MTYRQKLTPFTITKIRQPGRHTDGEGLALVVATDGSKRWVLRYRAPCNGRVRDMGLGPLRTVDLFAAREKAKAARALVARGVDPLDARAAEPTFAPTLASVRDDFIKALAPTWRNPKSEAQWRASLATYCGPLMVRDAASITDGDIVAALEPIWHTKPETAARILDRLTRILDHARVLRLRDGDNPALWAKKRLGKQRIVKGHHAAVPLVAIPDLVRRLGEEKGTANTAFRLLILTGMRSGEILGLRWSEVDFEAQLLNLPGARMKAGVAFRVPLSDAAATILSEIPHTNELVFPGRSGKRLSAPIFERILKRLEVPGTPHGIRSALAGWAAERGTALEVIDASLAHRIGTAVTRAYVRGDFLPARRDLLAAWAAYCMGETGTVVSFGRRPA